ncbi:MAG TPA: hypothetical protein VM425_12830 [Myxococcota bacterium]|nr:hypothetical protein [Myxococcota bacterium]
MRRILAILILSSLLVGAALYMMNWQVGQLEVGDNYSDETDLPLSPASEQDPVARALELYHQATSQQQSNPLQALLLAREALEVTPPEATGIMKMIEELIGELEEQVDEPPLTP